MPKFENLLPILQAESFPVAEGSTGYQYITSYPIAHFTPELYLQAKALAKDITNLTHMVLAVRGWLNNHAYDEHKRPYLKATDILDSRLTTAQEVCDRRLSSCGAFATLGATLLRSLGVGVRLIDGAHSKSADHAWIEVYYPQADLWIPFDFTGFGDAKTGLINNPDYTTHHTCLDWSEIEDALHTKHQAWVDGQKNSPRQTPEAQG